MGGDAAVPGVVEAEGGGGEGGDGEGTAAPLHLAESTVKTHVKRIPGRLGARPLAGGGRRVPARADGAAAPPADPAGRTVTLRH